MKTKAEILERHIHPTKFLSSLSTETGKLSIFRAMDEYAQSVAMEFAEWKTTNGFFIVYSKSMDNEKVWYSKNIDGLFTTFELFAKFEQERNQNNGG
jgi:hypothetical protein